MCVFFFSFSIIWIIVVSAVVAECATVTTVTTVKESGGEEGARHRRRERQTDSCLPSTPPTFLLTITYPTVNFIQVTDLDRSLHYYTHKHTYILLYTLTKRRQNVNKTAIYIYYIARVDRGNVQWQQEECAYYSRYVQHTDDTTCRQNYIGILNDTYMHILQVHTFTRYYCLRIIRIGIYVKLRSTYTRMYMHGELKQRYSIGTAILYYTKVH